MTATMSEMLYRYYSELGPDDPLVFCPWGFGHYWHDEMTYGQALCPEHSELPLNENLETGP